MAPRLAISLGDPSGIGAEVTAAALTALGGEVEPLLFGDPGLLARGLSALRLPVIELGEPVPRGGALVAVTRLPAAALKAGRPVGARRLGPARLPHRRLRLGAERPGRRRSAPRPSPRPRWPASCPASSATPSGSRPAAAPSRSVMMLAGERLKVALVTNHAPLSRVRAGAHARR